MATFSNLGLKLIAQGDEAGTWGTTTNTNLDIVDESFQYNSKNFTSDANLTFFFFFFFYMERAPV